MGVVILRLVQFRNAWGSSTVRPCTTSNTCSTLIIPRYQPLVHLGHRHHHHNFHWYDKFVNEKPKIEFQEITPSQHQKRVGAHNYQRARDTGWYGTWWNWVSLWQYWLVLGGTGVFIISWNCLVWVVQGQYRALMPLPIYWKKWSFGQMLPITDILTDRQ